MATLLHQAAVECGYIDQTTVETILGISGDILSETSPIGFSEELTPGLIVRLASVIKPCDMETIALGYMNIDEVTVKIDWESKSGKAFNRGIIEHWLTSNPCNPVKVSEYQSIKCGVSQNHKFKNLTETLQSVTLEM